MSAVMTERLMAVAQAARLAEHGSRGAIYDAACLELGLTRSTLMRKIKEVAVSTQRKRRSDAGQTALTRDEALLISAVLMESARKNAKRLYSVADAVETLRANKMVQATSLVKSTGELRPMSESAIQRALRGYGLHPDQLLAPAPVTELASLHPNHVWQVDASLCVLYYLKPAPDKRANGLRVMDHAEFYKNKPKNVARITADRVWSYEITDHASGWIYVEYVMGAESGENLCTVLINAMQERGGADLLHGVPRILMLDPGSANTAAMTKNLCRTLGIQMEIHKPGNARATGQVENARNIIERKLEPGLKFQPVNSLDELNALAKKWRAHFNATAEHRRHGLPRSSAWMKIRADQLVKAPSVEVCRELAVAEPESRKISPKLRVSFRGCEYDVSGVAGALVGETLMVTRNPWRADAAQVVLINDEGREVYQVVNEVEKNELGFSLDAAVIGEGFKARADTPAQTALKEIEQLVTGTDSQEAAEAARKAKALPFGGQIDPYKHIDDAVLPTFMPRRGTALNIPLPTVETPVIPIARAAKHLRDALGDSYSPDVYAWLSARYPDGVPDEETLSRITQDWKPQSTQDRPKLVAVGGR